MLFQIVVKRQPSGYGQPFLYQTVGQVTGDRVEVSRMFYQALTELKDIIQLVVLCSESDVPSSLDREVDAFAHGGTYNFWVMDDELVRHAVEFAPMSEHTSLWTSPKPYWRWSSHKDEVRKIIQLMTRAQAHRVGGATDGRDKYGPMDDNKKEANA